MTGRAKALVALATIAAIATTAVAMATLGTGNGGRHSSRIVAALNPGHAALAATAGPTAPRPPNEPVRVSLYGDSLAWQAQQYFDQDVTARGRAIARAYTFGGTAICDWFAQMREDAATWHPQAVVIEFSGNAFTACMRRPDGAPLSGAERNAKYLADARQVVDIFSPTGARLYFASAPITRQADEDHSLDWNALNTMYSSVAVHTPDARFADAAAAVEYRGRYSDTLPCLTDEPCTGGVDAAGHGVNVVRAPDGVHFCPGAPSAVDGVTASCSVWSSGSFRYGRALAAEVVGDFDL